MAAMSLEVERIQALAVERSGSLVVSLPSLPWAADVLSDELKHSLHRCTVQSSREPLRLSAEKAPTLGLSTLLRLRNSRAVEFTTLQPGWRRWYREFRADSAVASQHAQLHRTGWLPPPGRYRCQAMAIAAEARARWFLDAGWLRICQHALVRR